MAARFIRALGARWGAPARIVAARR